MRLLPAVLLAFATCAALGAQDAPEAREELHTPEAKACYALGMQAGMFLRQFGGALDAAALVRGATDAAEGKPPLMTQEEAERFLTDFVRQAEKDLAEKNRKYEEAFLAENAKKPGVVTTKSGLQYIVLRKGDGPLPGPTDAVRAHYHGTLPDGTVFDSSVERKQMATFNVDGVIAGWREALQLMPVGSKFRLFVPAALAYGERRRSEKIGPNQMLIFDVELLEIVK